MARPRRPACARTGASTPKSSISTTPRTAPARGRYSRPRARCARSSSASPARSTPRSVRDCTAARERLGAFVGADVDRLAFTTNVTVALNSAIGSVALSPDDEVLVTNHEYNATRQIIEHTTRRAGARCVVAEMPFVGIDDDAVIEAVLAATSERTRLAVLDHVTSPDRAGAADRAPGARARRAGRGRDRRRGARAGSARSRHRVAGPGLVRRQLSQVAVRAEERGLPLGARRSPRRHPLRDREPWPRRRRPPRTISRPVRLAGHRRPDRGALRARRDRDPLIVPGRRLAGDPSPQSRPRRGGPAPALRGARCRGALRRRDDRLHGDAAPARRRRLRRRHRALGHRTRPGARATDRGVRCRGAGLHLRCASRGG